MYERQKRYFKTLKGKQARRRANQKYYEKLMTRRILDMGFQLRQMVRKHRFWVIPVSKVYLTEGG